MVIIYHLQQKVDYTLRHGLQTYVGAYVWSVLHNVLHIFKWKMYSEDSSGFASGKKVVKSSLLASRENITRFAFFVTAKPIEFIIALNSKVCHKLRDIIWVFRETFLAPVGHANFVIKSTIR